MRYRLPLELELAILELAAPPLAFDHLHDRVDYFIKISLVHRSLTAWAQDRLRDQFLYTYRSRSDEHERLKKRFEAGFGRQRLLRRLYLDLSRLPEKIDKRKKPGSDSISATIDGQVYAPESSGSGPGGPGQVASTAQGQACEAVAHYVQNASAQISNWEVCAMITAYCQALDTLWLKPPIVQLDIADLPPPRVLHIDTGTVDSLWGGFAMIPASSETVLFLRNVSLGADKNDDGLSTRQLIFEKCWAHQVSVDQVLDRCPHLETLVLSEMHPFNLIHLIRTVDSLPTSVRHAHILQHDIYTGNIDVDHSAHPRVLPHLESFMYTFLSSRGTAPRMPADDEADADALSEVQQAIETRLDAPQCTFKYLRMTESPEDALAGALSALKLDL